MDEPEPIDPAIHVLVIDDHDTIVEIVRAILESRGFVVSSADNGLSGIRTAMEGRFDLLLIDIRMPGMDGFEVARTLRRSIGPNRAAPFVAFTAESNIEGFGTQDASVFNDLVTKPIVPEILLTVLNRLAARYRTPIDSQSEFSGRNVDTHQGRADD